MTTTEAITAGRHRGRHHGPFGMMPLIFRRIGRSRSRQLLRQRARDPGFADVGCQTGAPRPSSTASTSAPEQRKRLAVTGRRALAGCPASVVTAILVIAPPRRPVPAEDWNELTSSAALKDRDSSRDLWSRCRFAVHRPGIPEASPRSHGMPCRGSAPGGAGARLIIADSYKV